MFRRSLATRHFFIAALATQFKSLAGGLCFMLNQRAGTPVKPEDYEGIRLYWAPKDIHETRERLKGLGYGVSELEHRDYGQTEFFLTDDGYSHCFAVPTQR